MCSPVPIGTVPIYEALERVGGDVSKISWEVFKQVRAHTIPRPTPCTALPQLSHTQRQWGSICAR